MISVASVLVNWTKSYLFYKWNLKTLKFNQPSKIAAAQRNHKKAASKQVNLLLEIAACTVNDAEDCIDYYFQLV